ncbi:MAG TPA: glycosyltransferase family 39 protein [Pyrinomonadaceae bacterium]|nr:glycosyltransferase family 39 protein [Pyrinomonadaceae bacterium]
MQPSTLAKRGWLLLLTAAAVVYFYGLGRAPFVGADEPRYAQVAREMYERGDAVTPTLGGRTWFEKPALVYWAAAAGYKIFGVAEWTARLGVALAGWLTVFVVGWTARRVELREDEEGARWLQLAAGAAMATSAGLIVFSRGVNFDIFITASVACALAFFLAAELEPVARAKRLLLAGFYAGMGLALLAKGLIGVVIPVGVVCVYYLLRRRWPEAWKSALWGLPLTLLVASVWYAPVIARHGWTFVDEFFVKHHFARYLSNKYHHPQPFWFYLAIIPALALPWSAFLGAGVWHARRWRWRSGDDGADAPDESDALGKLRLFALAWVLFPLLFFSVSGSKLPGYILPALPGAALLVGERLAAYVRGEGGVRAMRATGALMILLAAAGAFYEWRVSELSRACIALVAAPIVAAGAYVSLVSKRREMCVLVVVGVSFLTTMLILVCAVERVAARESVRDLLHAADARGYGAAPVLNLHTVERTSQFYAAGRLVYDDARGEPRKFEGVGEVREVLRARGGTLLVIVPEEYVRQLLDFQPFEVEVIGDNGTNVLVAVRAR